MLIPGLVSVTLRSLSVTEILALVAEAGLRAIEWGGDVHVPVGNLAHAHDVGRWTRDAGLIVSSYGSYHRLGQGAEFEPVLKTALALGAPTIRVWAGTQGSAEASQAYRQTVAQELHQVAEMADREGVAIGLEFHGGTLTDTVDSTLALLEASDFPQAKTYWQPPHGLTEAERLDGLQRLGTRVSNLHVFHWTPEGDKQVRHPLADGRALWEKRLALVAELPGDRYALLEFVQGDDPRQVVADGKTLVGLV